jgi:hypothetical protein
VTDPRGALRAVYGRWLRVRANVRALATSLAAAEHGLRRDARRTGDADLETLTAQLVTERQAIESLGRELDVRIAAVKRDCAAVDARHVQSIAAAARRR